MIVKIEEVRTPRLLTWFVKGIDSDESICIATCPVVSGEVNVEIGYDDNTFEQELRYNPNVSGSLKERLLFKFYEKGNFISDVNFEYKKVKGFLQSYNYFSINYQGYKYSLYEVGFGSKGLYLCIYKDDELIATADKDLKVVNYKDTYTIYIKDRQYFRVCMPLIMHYEVTHNGNMTELAVRSVRRTKVNTVSKELRAKFDPEFIAKVKEMNNIRD